MIKKIVQIKINIEDRDVGKLFEEKWGEKPGQTAGWVVVSKYKSDAPIIRRFFPQKKDAIKSRNSVRERRRYYVKRGKDRYPDIYDDSNPNDMRWYVKPIRIIPR